MKVKRGTIGCMIVATTLSLGAATTGHAARMDLDQAVEICTERAIRFGRQLNGRYADEPPAYRVQSEYRACVWANAGEYPRAPVVYRDSILTSLRNALQ